ncbi:MinD/ParA family ATP-binding protein [Halobacterium noricense]|uniref:MinD/ParA family ATP-binding protein n=1 Tax=Halobacterium noricense TaxID=223182 RepID=UPI001E31F986|nr:AAA family ATPase [Halobacterium noricense]UHH24311.1 AAA family ATPase [Halobacterium noricense]
MLAVAGGKGGSGKTTTALGLAGALVERRRRPLVVDCDLDAPNLHLRAGVPRDPGVDADSPTAAAHESSTVPGVDVLPAGDANGDDLAAALDALPDSRPIVLDCPAGASEAAARPLRAADGCVVVATDSREGIEDAVKTAAMARAVGTPVRAIGVTRVAAAPARLADATAADTVPVPAAAAPLEAPETAAAYAMLADYVEPNT